jgi:hypothetical protein
VLDQTIDPCAIPELNDNPECERDGHVYANFYGTVDVHKNLLVISFANITDTPIPGGNTPVTLAFFERDDIDEDFELVAKFDYDTIHNKNYERVSMAINDRSVFIGEWHSFVGDELEDGAILVFTKVRECRKN